MRCDAAADTKFVSVGTEYVMKGTARVSYSYHEYGCEGLLSRSQSHSHSPAASFPSLSSLISQLAILYRTA
jgi:hypothetical protein